MGNFIFETFQEFDNHFFESKVNESINTVFDVNKNQVVLNRDSECMSMSVGNIHYLVDIKEYVLSVNNEILKTLTFYKSINNDYLYIVTD